MLVALLTAALAADPPSLEHAVVSGARTKKDVGVVIGEEDFHALPHATGADADAAAMADFLVSTRGIDPSRVQSIHDVTVPAARDAITLAARSVKRGGTLWIYWSGHGAVVDGARMLLGNDAAADTLATTGLPLADIVALGEASKAKQVLIVLDVGFGGVGRDGEALFDGPPSVPSIPVKDGSKVSVWASTTAADAASSYPATAHGMFSYFAVGALRGWADGQSGTPADGTVTLQEAEGYVARVVRSVGGPDQKPGKDTRADIAAWVLAQGKLEAGPSKEDLASLALSEKLRRVQKAEEKLRKVATKEWADIAPTTVAASPASEATLKDFIARYDAATVTVDGAQVAVAVPEVADARGRLDSFARAADKANKRKRKKRTSARAAVVAAAVPVPTAPCADLLVLEPMAIVGQLTPELTACVETRLAAEQQQTTRDKLSRLLLINADAKGDIPEWTRLAARHLEEIDRSDPDLCFKFALVLSRGGIEDAELVLKWADYALENKHQWEGATYTSRVYNLLRLRAETATRLWHDAESDFIDERTDENEAQAELYRGEAKDFSREWLDYARTSAQPLERAVTLCESAAGNAAFCSGN